jgi:hypothetical protein
MCYKNASYYVFNRLARPKPCGLLALRWRLAQRAISFERITETTFMGIEWPFSLTDAAATKGVLLEVFDCPGKHLQSIKAT